MLVANLNKVIVIVVKHTLNIKMLAKISQEFLLLVRDFLKVNG